MTSAHPPEDGRIFLKECVSLAKGGYDVYLVERGDTYEKNGVHIAGVGKLPANRLKRMILGARKVYKKALEIDADIYHFHDPELLFYGLRLKRKGKTVIFDSHERYYLQIKTKPYLPPFLSKIIAEIYQIIETYAVRRLDAVIFPSLKNGKNPFEGKCRNTAVISNAVMIDEIYDQYDEDFKKSPSTICYIGSLSKERGITEAIKAACRADAKLILAGRFSPAEYESEVRSMPEFSHVDYRGVLNREEIVAVLKESVIGICALLNVGQYWKMDTFGIKVYEYMAMGLPVILNVSAYNNAMIQKYDFGVCIDPTDLNEYADAIRFLLEHPARTMQMGMNGRKAVHEEFNWGIEEKKLFKLYSDLIEQAKSV